MIEGLALIDWVTITLITVFCITGFFNGFIKELFSASAWIVSLALSWLYGPLLFPYVQEFIEADSIKNIISFTLLFLISFIALKIIGSIVSKFLSAFGLKGLDKLLGIFFGALKTVAVLSSIFIFNLSYLDTNKWWIDSYSRIYSIKFYEYSKPVFDEWIDKVDTILQKDNSKITL